MLCSQNILVTQQLLIITIMVTAITFTKMTTMEITSIGTITNWGTTLIKS